VHGHGFESFTFLVNGGVVGHGHGFESEGSNLGLWWSIVV
jgi:hypothetical protein